MHSPANYDARHALRIYLELGDPILSFNPGKLDYQPSCLGLRRLFWVGEVDAGDEVRKLDQNSRTANQTEPSTWPFL